MVWFNWPWICSLICLKLGSFSIIFDWMPNISRADIVTYSGERWKYCCARFSAPSSILFSIYLLCSWIFITHFTAIRIISRIIVIIKIIGVNLKTRIFIDWSFSWKKWSIGVVVRTVENYFVSAVGCVGTLIPSVALVLILILIIV